MLPSLCYLPAWCPKLGTCSPFLLLVFSHSHNLTPVWTVVSEAFQFLTDITFCSFTRIQLKKRIVVKSKCECAYCRQNEELSSMCVKAGIGKYRCLSQTG